MGPSLVSRRKRWTGPYTWHIVLPVRSYMYIEYVADKVDGVVADLFFFVVKKINMITVVDPHPSSGTQCFLDFWIRDPRSIKAIVFPRAW